MLLATADGWSPAEVTALVAIVGLVLAALSAGWAKRLTPRAWSALSEAPPATDEGAARALGQSLGDMRVSAEVIAEVMAAFWAAEAPTRRDLAYAIAGLLEAVSIHADPKPKILAIVQCLRVPVTARPDKDTKGPQSN
jgi:hypothetical protein